MTESNYLQTIVAEWTFYVERSGIGYPAVIESKAPARGTGRRLLGLHRELSRTRWHPAVWESLDYPAGS
jgi:hypothetical protein